MEKKERIVRLMTQKLSIHSALEGFTDIRVHPQIKLQTILMCVLLMPIYCRKSLLSLDRWARQVRSRQLFNCRRPLVASDSTFARVLSWLREDQTAALLRTPLRQFFESGLLERPLRPGGRRWRLGIIDGSFMSGHWVSVCILLGVIRFPALIHRMSSRGEEMAEAKKMFASMRELFGPATPELMLLDAYYFTRSVFRLARGAGAEVLVKFRDADLRTVSKDVALHFRHFGGEVEAEGYDGERLCRYRIRVMCERFAGVPVLVAEVFECYSKREADRREEHFWLICSELSLSPEELREAAHLRWQIETEVFRRLNGLCATKRGYTRHPRAFVNLLRLLSLSLAILDAFMATLGRHRHLRRRLIKGQKPTWEAVTEAITEAFPAGLFALPP